MKKTVIFLLSVLLAISIVLVGCNDAETVQPDEGSQAVVDNTGTQTNNETNEGQTSNGTQNTKSDDQQTGNTGNETVKTTEEYLSSDMSKSTLLGLSRDLEKATNVRLVKELPNATYTYCFVGEDASRIYENIVEFREEGSIVGTIKTNIWKDGDQYIYAYSVDEYEGNEENHRKEYMVVSEEEYQEEFGHLNPGYVSWMEGCIDMLSDSGCVVSGKKITKGDSVTYEINVRKTTAYSDSEKSVQEFNIVAEGSKIISIVHTNTDGGERWIEETNIEYNFDMQVPSLEGYTLREDLY